MIRLLYKYVVVATVLLTSTCGGKKSSNDNNSDAAVTQDEVTNNGAVTFDINEGGANFTNGLDVVVYIPSGSVSGSDQGRVIDNPPYDSDCDGIGTMLRSVQIDFTKSNPGNRYEINGGYKLTYAIKADAVPAGNIVACVLEIDQDTLEISDRIFYRNSDLEIKEKFQNNEVTIALRLGSAVFFYDNGGNDAVPDSYQIPALANPGLLSYSEDTTSSFKLTWEQALGDTGQFAYVASISSSGSPEAGCAGAGSTNSAPLTSDNYIFTGLNASTTYYLRVCTTKDGNTSDGRTGSRTTISGGGGGGGGGGGDSGGFAVFVDGPSGVQFSENVTDTFGNNLETVGSTGGLLKSAVVRDSSNEFHVCVNTGSTINFRKGTQGTWSSVDTVGTTLGGDIAAYYDEGESRLYCYYTDGGAIYEAEKSFLGPTTMEIVGASSGYSRFYTTKFSANRYLFHSAGATADAHLRNSSDFSSYEPINDDGSSSLCSNVSAAGLDVDATNKINLLYICASGVNNILVHARFTTSWSYTAIDTISGAISDAAMFRDKNNKLHVAYLASTPSQMVRYITNKTGSWSTPINVLSGVDPLTNVRIAVTFDLTVGIAFNRDPVGSNEAVLVYSKIDALSSFDNAGQVYEKPGEATMYGPYAIFPY